VPSLEKHLRQTLGAAILETAAGIRPDPACRYNIDQKKINLIRARDCLHLKLRTPPAIGLACIACAICAEV
jgi:hypothetical protein